MPTVRRLVRAALVSGALLLSTAAHAATTFNFQFDGNSFTTPRGQIGAPVIGTGVFTSATDLQPGIYALNSLGGYTMSFFGGAFDQTHVATPAADVAVRVSNYASGFLRLQFTENGAGNTGPFNGSLDLVNGASEMSFEPTFNGGNDFYVKDNTFGNYLALARTGGAVPEPSTWAMMLLGFGFLGAAMRKSRRQPATLAA